MDNPYASPLSNVVGENRPSAWVRQVPVVAVLLITEGVLELCFGLLLAMRWQFFGLNAAVITALLSFGLLKIVAGVRNRRYRNRGLGLAALGSAIFTMVSIFCLPTALLLAIYGVVIYLHRDVVLAFRQGGVAA